MAKTDMDGETFHRRIRMGPEERRRVVREMFEAHYARYVGTALRRGIPLDDAEGLSGDVFLRLWHHCETESTKPMPENPAPPLNWLNVVAKNLRKDYFRKRDGRAKGKRAPRPPDVQDDVTAQNAPRNADRAVIEQDDDIDQRGDPGEPHGFEEARRIAAICQGEMYEAFEERHPDEAAILSAFEDGSMTIEDIQSELKCPTEHAARERLSQMRILLRRICLEFCEAEVCPATHTAKTLEARTEALALLKERFPDAWAALAPHARGDMTLDEILTEFEGFPYRSTGPTPADVRAKVDIVRRELTDRAAARRKEKSDD